MAQLLTEALSCLTGTRGSTPDVVTVLNENILDCLQKLNTTFNDVVKSPHLSRLYFQVSEFNDVHWRFICTSCHLFLCLADSLKCHAEDLTSLCQQKNIRSLLQFIVTFGIQPSLIPGVGIPRDKRNQDNSNNSPPEILTEFEKYARLGAVCRCLYELCSLADLKTIVFTHFLGEYLGALLQLCYAPIAKPNTTITFASGTFTMTPEIWLKVQTERKEFQLHLNDILLNTYQPSIIKELVILQGNVDPSLPNFMKKALVKHLSICLLSPSGLNSTIKCFLDSTTVDTGTQWKQVDLITRLIAVKHSAISEEEYLINICNQIRNVILENPNNDYTVVGAACVSSLYQKYSSVICVNELIKSIIAPLLLDEALPGSTLSPSEINKLIDTLDLCFTHPKLRLPSNFLTPIIYHLFSMRIVSKRNQLLSSKLNNLIINHFLAQSCKTVNWFSSIIFGKSNDEIIVTKTKAVFESCLEGINVKVKSKTSITPSIESSVNCLLDMIVDFQDSNSLACNLFVFLIDIISKSKSHIDSELNKDSKLLECENIVDEASENYLIFSKALETLANMECVLKSFKHDPSFIVKFIVQYLEECIMNIGNGIEDSNNEECVNICLILLATLLAENIHNDTLKPYLKRIETSSSELLSKSSHLDVKLLSKEVNDLLCVKSSKKQHHKSRFDEAISEVCDALLPVRAHGLMQLIKLIEHKDSETVSKKHYVLCIFQENLKDEDSYVYLTAINGLASLAKYCPDDVLEIMSKEYLNVNTKSSSSEEDENSIKLRMKIGEILVKITSNLGEMAEIHKTILLNTFLCGCRDPDDLIRASSLSNLAELARVLSYKLGSIIFEILNCIHAIIQTDKSPECRRASVMVISSLIKGLGTESLFFLKEALLPMYRTLKQLYSDEKEDDAVRLHAQIALEELNSIMKELMAPYLK